MQSRSIPLVIASPDDALADAVCQILKNNETRFCQVRTLSGACVSTSSERGRSTTIRDNNGIRVCPATIAWVLFRDIPCAHAGGQEDEYRRDEWLSSLAPVLTGEGYRIANSPYTTVDGVFRPSTSWGTRSWLRRRCGPADGSVSRLLTNARGPAPGESAFTYPQAHAADPTDIRLALRGHGLIGLHRSGEFRLWYALSIAGQIVAGGEMDEDGIVEKELPRGALHATAAAISISDPISLLWLTEHRAENLWDLVGYDPFPPASLLGHRLDHVARLLVGALEK